MTGIPPSSSNLPLLGAYQNIETNTQSSSESEQKNLKRSNQEDVTDKVESKKYQRQDYNPPNNWINKTVTDFNLSSTTTSSFCANANTETAVTTLSVVNPPWPEKIQFDNDKPRTLSGSLRRGREIMQLQEALKSNKSLEDFTREILQKAVQAQEDKKVTWIKWQDVEKCYVDDIETTAREEKEIVKIAFASFFFDNTESQIVVLVDETGTIQNFRISDVNPPWPKKLRIYTDKPGKLCRAQRRKNEIAKLQKELRSKKNLEDFTREILQKAIQAQEDKKVNWIKWQAVEKRYEENIEKTERGEKEIVKIAFASFFFDNTESQIVISVDETGAIQNFRIFDLGHLINTMVDDYNATNLNLPSIVTSSSFTNANIETAVTTSSGGNLQNDTRAWPKELRFDADKLKTYCSGREIYKLKQKLQSNKILEHFPFN